MVPMVVKPHSGFTITELLIIVAIVSLLLALALSASWGANMVAIKICLESIPPIWGAFWRMLCGLPILWLWARALKVERRRLWEERRDGGQHALMDDRPAAGIRQARFADAGDGDHVSVSVSCVRLILLAPIAGPNGEWNDDGIHRRLDPQIPASRRR